jgi:NAD(P)-dependent dehydrogenase (short-subunit alcohol dehydrogenase family)
VCQALSDISGKTALREHCLARMPMQRLGSADDVVGACLFLASPAGSYTTGTTLNLDGGMARCR